MAGLTNNLKGLFYTGVVTGSANIEDPIQVAKDAVNTIPVDKALFMVLHSYAGTRSVWGYYYHEKKYGSIFISHYNNPLLRVDIADGVYSLKDVV